MYVHVTCRHCAKSFKLAAKFAGKKGRCPNPECQAVFLVPQPADDSENEWSDPVEEQPVRRGALPPRQLPRGSSPAAPRRAERNWLVPASLGGGGVVIAVVLLMVFAGGGSAPTTNASAANDASAPAAPVVREETEEEKLRKLGLERVRRLEPIAMKDDVGFPHTVQPFLQKYCIDCHTGAEAMAGIGLDEYPDKAAVLENRKIWEKVFAMLDIGAMPPKDGEQPPPEEHAAVLAWLDDALHNLDCNAIDDPGRVTVRRLNINEYNNTIRDLFGVDLQPGKNFPADDVGEGFDNIGDVLSLPPLLMEKYFDAAELVADAVISETMLVPTVRKSGRDFQTEGSANAGDGEISFPSQGTATATFELPADGEYVLQIRASASQAGDEPAKMRITIDGVEWKIVDVPEERERNYEYDWTATAGAHRVGVAFINDFYDPTNPNRRRRDRNLFVSHVELIGPQGGVYVEPPEVHRQFVVASPSDTQSPKQAATQVFSAQLPRIFRRPVAPAEVEPFAALVEQVVADGESYEQGVRLALQAALVSPSFLFRVEDDPRPDDPDYGRKLRDYEIASRISYFLWSSLPDAELFALAEAGKLSQPAVLEAQARRMLADPKSRALVENFGGQWLNLRNLDEIDFSRRRYREFNSDLRRDMVRETLTFFESIIREDRSIVDFLDAKYTFVNERLARFYEIPDVQGDEFRQVSLEGTPRAGLLTQASILALTSNPTRTSPVKRGKWIMENILGTPPPPPPPGVPPLEDAGRAAPDATLAERLALHRQDPGCASCHNQMDPLGLAFEKFDAIGKVRERDGQNPVDDSGELPGGRKFNGAAELIEILKERKRDFSVNFTEKMLTYALGRGLKYYDACAVDRIVGELERDDHRFSRVVVGVILSDPFLKKRGDGGVE